MQDAWLKKLSREDMHTALLRLTMVQLAGGKKRGGGAWKLDDFLPEYAKPEDDDPTGEKALMAEWEAMTAKQK